MTKNSDDKGWAPVHEGDMYCSPRCGRGCTKEEFDEATEDANRLLTKLPNFDFSIRVWENLGWHYTVVAERKGDCSIEISEHISARHPTSYWVNIKLNDVQHCGTFSDPEKGIKRLVRNVKKQADNLCTFIDQLKRSKTRSG